MSIAICGDCINVIDSKAIAVWCIKDVGDPRTARGPREFKAAVLARYQERYADFGPTLAAEKLALEGWVVDHETLRGWLMKAGLWQKRRKRAQHRSWRERRAHFGELIQLDGSHHKWFEARATMLLDEHGG